VLTITFVASEALAVVTVMPVAALTTLEIAGLRITPVPVDHVVPTFGFIVEDERSAVVFSSDTGATEAIWQQASLRSNLKAAFLEVSFPNDQAPLALISKHHTPASFALETHKLHSPVPFYAYHLKPRYVSQLVSELEALGMPNLNIASPGRTYSF
jgi:ribonuclease BN (tRNA processing enzyme)